MHEIMTIISLFILNMTSSKQYFVQYEIRSLHEVSKMLMIKLLCKFVDDLNLSYIANFYVNENIQVLDLANNVIICLISLVTFKANKHDNCCKISMTISIWQVRHQISDFMYKMSNLHWSQLITHRIVSFNLFKAKHVISAFLFFT